jgi:hypothetical protein
VRGPDRMQTRPMQIIEIHTSIRGAVDDAIARAVAIGGLLGIAVIHVLQLPEAFAEIGYLGALFIAAVAGSVVLAAALARTSDDRAWAGAGALAALILIGYLLSRSVGLPGFTGDTGNWSEAPGLVSMVVESLEIVLAGTVLATRLAPRWRAARANEPATGGAGGFQPGAARS